MFRPFFKIFSLIVFCLFSEINGYQLLYLLITFEHHVFLNQDTTAPMSLWYRQTTRDQQKQDLSGSLKKKKKSFSLIIISLSLSLSHFLTFVNHFY